MTTGSLSVETIENSYEAQLDVVIKKLLRHAPADSAKYPELPQVMTRVTTAILRLLSQSGNLIDTKAYENRDDLGFIVAVVENLVEQDPFISKEALLRLKGQEALRRMLLAYGGTYSAAEVAELLQISPDGVRKRLRRNRLLSLTKGRHRVYPAFQFYGGDVTPHFEEILTLLQTNSDAAKIQFFLGYDADLGDTPIEALRKSKHLELVERKAKQYGHHGAA